MARRSPRSALSGRGFLLVPAAALGVHELRYLAGYGSSAGAALAAQGHGYLQSLGPWVSLLLACALGGFLRRVAAAAAGRSAPRSRRSFAGLWLLASSCLVVAYGAQETLEGLFASGHPGGVGGVVGHGGWWAVPLSLAFGLLVAALLRVADRIETGLAARGTRAAESTAEPVVPRPALPGGRRRAPLAGDTAGRAPPVVTVAVAR